jgi:hypothetical protein
LALHYLSHQRDLLHLPDPLHLHFLLVLHYLSHLRDLLHLPDP